MYPLRALESWNICESENNKNNKTIRNIWVQKGNPNEEVRARVYCNLVRGYILEFRVRCSEFRVAHIFIWLSALCELLSGQGYGT